MENPFRRLSKAPTNPVHHSHAARTGGLGGSSAEAGGSGDPQISQRAYQFDHGGVDGNSGDVAKSTDVVPQSTDEQQSSARR